MKLSDGVEWGVHVCTVLAVLPPDAALPAPRLAEYHGVPSAYLAKHLQALARAGVLETVKGPRGGYRLARPPAEITVLEVVEAIEPLVGHRRDADRRFVLARRGNSGQRAEEPVRARPGEADETEVLHRDEGYRSGSVLPMSKKTKKRKLKARRNRSNHGKRPRAGR